MNDQPLDSELRAHFVEIMRSVPGNSVSWNTTYVVVRSDGGYLSYETDDQMRRALKFWEPHVIAKGWWRPTAEQGRLAI